MTKCRAGKPNDRWRSIAGAATPMRVMIAFGAFQVALDVSRLAIAPVG